MNKIKISFRKPSLNNISLKNIKATKISLRNLFIITFKEVYNFFTQPIGYIISALFIAAFIIVVFGVSKFTQFGTNNLTSVFGYLAFIMAISVPAITMSSISREKQLGTIEYILTRPIREIEYVLGKILGNSLLVTFLILLTLPFVFIASNYLSFDVGQLFMQYLGAIVLGISIVALGVAVSATYKNEIGAFLTTVILSAILILLDSDLLRLPISLDFFVERFGLLSHYQSVSKGVLDVRDLIYFAGFIITFTLVGYFFVRKDKFPEKHSKKIELRNLVIFSIVITLVLGVVGQQISGRLDLTSSQLYTLSDSSINTINSVKDIVTIDFYRSSGLPLEYQADITTFEDILNDYRSLSGGKVELIVKDPTVNASYKTEAESEGIIPVTFNAADNNSAQSVSGYLGLIVKFQDKKEVLNLIDTNTSNFVTNPEYEITKRIRKISNDDLKKIAFVSNNVKVTRAGNYVTLDNEMSNLFEVIDLELKEDTGIPDDVEVLILASPNIEFSEKIINQIQEFYKNGGNIFFLTNTINASHPIESVSANDSSLSDLFSEYGITINPEIVYDLENNVSIRIDRSIFTAPYPFWMLAKPTSEDISILNGVNQLSILWSNSINLDKKDNNKYWELFRTGDFANGDLIKNANIATDREYTYDDSFKSRLLAVATENAQGGRAVIIADSKLFDDNFGLPQQSSNLAFGLASIEWLANEDGLSVIKAKDRNPQRISLGEGQERTLIAASFLIPLAILALVGGGTYYFRRRENSKWSN